MPGNNESKPFGDLTEFAPPTEEVGELTIEDRMTCDSFTATLEEMKTGLEPGDEMLADMVCHMVGCPDCLGRFNAYGAGFLDEQPEER